MTLEELIIEYGTAKMRHGAAVLNGNPAERTQLSCEAMNLYVDAHQRVAELRKLCAEQMMRPGHPQTLKIHVDDILRILDGEK
jgi:hypothetical protein